MQSSQWKTSGQKAKISPCDTERISPSRWRSLDGTKSESINYKNKCFKPSVKIWEQIFYFNGINRVICLEWWLSFLLPSPFSACHLRTDPLLNWCQWVFPSSVSWSEQTTSIKGAVCTSQLLPWLSRVAETTSVNYALVHFSRADKTKKAWLMVKKLSTGLSEESSIHIHK